MRVELGNRRPHHRPNGGDLIPVERPGMSHAVENSVTYITIADYDDQYGNRLYTFPEGDRHDDASLPPDISEALLRVPEENRQLVRRALIDQRFNHASGVKGFPDHEAFAAVAHPNGVWNNHSALEDDPTWVWSDNPGLQHMLALYYGIDEGRPGDIEETHWTRHATGTFAPGETPPPIDPIVDLQALHTSWGRDHQAIAQGGAGPALTLIGQSGLLTAVTATTATFAAGTSHAANDMAGQVLFVGPNNAGAGTTVYGNVVSNTSGTTPVATVDRWYVAATPGGAAATTPSATGSYLLMIGGCASIFVGLSTDTTAKSVGGANGTADATAATTTLTGEIVLAGGGLIRKIGVMAHTAAAATWTNTPVFTANGTDSLPVTVGTAVLSPSLSTATVANVAMLAYLTLVTPTATLSANGDQLTLTWTFTMT